MAKKKPQGGSQTDAVENDAPVSTAVATAVTPPPPKEDPAIVRERMLAELRDSTQQEIRRFNPTLKQSEEDWREANEHAKSLKKIMEGNRLHLAMLCNRMTEAMDGTYQFPAPPAPTLPFPENKESSDSKPRLSAPDHGATLPIDALTAHGLTAKMCETLEAHDVKTIGDLESLMRIDPWWHKKIKGFGQERVDKVSDALFLFRREHPVPSAADSDAQTAEETSSSKPAGVASDKAGQDAAEDDGEEDTDGED